MGSKGRKALVDNWSQYLPMYSTQEPIAPQPQSHQTSPAAGSPVPPSESQPEEEDEEEELAEGETVTKKFSFQLNSKKIYRNIWY